MALKPCKENQVRNPVTNRCKKVTGRIPDNVPVEIPNIPKKGKKDCKPGQFRNPETGRCKKISLRPPVPEDPQPFDVPVEIPNIPKKGKKDCKPGQFLNPETGRCKKIPQAVAWRPPPPFAVSTPVVPAIPRFDSIFDNDDVNEDDGVEKGLNTQRISQLVKDLKQTRSKKEICVGHVLSYNHGTHSTNSIAENTMENWVNDFEGGRGRYYISNDDLNNSCFSLVMKIIQKHKEGELYPRVLNQSARVIHKHATQLGMFSPDGKNCSLWYFDPSSHTISREHKQWIAFDNEFRNKPWYKDMEKETELRDLQWNGSNAIDYTTYKRVIKSPDFPDEFIGTINRSRRNLIFAKHIHSVWKNSPRYNEIKKKLDIWRNDFNKNVPANLKIFLNDVPSEKTFMSTLFILKELLRADNMTIIHPSDSTPLMGPQTKYGDGFCIIRDGKSKLDKEIEKSGGACVVWVEIYKMYSKYYASKMSTVQDLILFLNSNPLMGQTSAKELLGKVMHLAYTKNITVIELINAVYDIIPDPNVDQNGRFIEDLKYTDNIVKVLNKDVRSFMRQERFARDLPEQVKRNFTLALSNGNSNISEVLKIWGTLAQISDDVLKSNDDNSQKDSSITDSSLIEMMLQIISCKHKGEAKIAESFR